MHVAPTLGELGKTLLISRDKVISIKAQTLHLSHRAVGFAKDANFPSLEVWLRISLFNILVPAPRGIIAGRERATYLLVLSRNEVM